MNMSDIGAAYAGVKFIKELLSGILDAKIETAAKEKINQILERIGPIQDTLFYLREELFRIQTENAELKEKLKASENWEKKLEEYQITKTAGGAVVYQSKADPKHYVCPSCLNKKEIHILQDRRVMSGAFDCPGCDKGFPVNRGTYTDDPVPSFD